MCGKVQFWVFFCLFLAVAADSGAQQVIYSRPDCGVSFIVPPGWEEALAVSQGSGILLVHPNGNMEISIFLIPECKEPAECMGWISGSMGLVCPAGHFDTLLNGRRTLLFRGMFTRNRRPYRCLIAGIPCNNGLCIMRVECPEDCFTGHRSMIGQILASLKLDPV